jgi:hypothetical protein
MANDIYSTLNSIKKISNSSLTSLVDITNINFQKLSSANLEFLNAINYDTSLNSINLNYGTFEKVVINNTLNFELNGMPTFTIDSLGRAEGQELLVKVSESQRHRFTDFNDWPDVGVPGEVIYTGIQNNKPRFGEDFIGYLHDRGWVSLTTPEGPFDSLTINEQIGSPLIVPTPLPGKGIIWVGAPGAETDWVPDNQTVYFTDDQGQIFDIITDPCWQRIGYDSKFRLTGNVIPHNHNTNDLGTNLSRWRSAYFEKSLKIGSSLTNGAIQLIDGNQTTGYVLTSDSNGNASWQPLPGAGGSAPCSYVYITNFLANIPITITHSLNSESLVIQLIDTVTDEQIEGYYDNYQPWSVDVTLSKPRTNIKVIILVAGCVETTGSNFNYYFQPGAPTGSIPIGSRWMDSDTGIEYVYINDGNSVFWIEPVNSGTAGPAGPAGAPGPAGLGITDILYANLVTLKLAGTLSPGERYHITDRDIWVDALTEYDLSIEGMRTMRIIKRQHYISYTIWDSTAAYGVGDIAIWGASIWENLTGALGTFINQAELDSNWAVVPKSNTTYYETKSFEINYDIDNDWVTMQKDNRNNVILSAYDSYYSKNALGIISNPIDITDWGCPEIFNNICECIVNNSQVEITGNICKLGAISYNKSNYIIGNICTKGIFNNDTGSITNNLCDTISGNLTTGGNISSNSCSNITDNIVEQILNNTCKLHIANNNYADMPIIGNSNNGSIDSNVNIGGITYNSNNGNIYANSNAGYIENNSNSGPILLNSNNGPIRFNSNTGDIYNNSNDGYIERNSNTGWISSNTQLSGTCNIYRNINNGDIMGARTTDIFDVIVDK